MAYKDHPQSPIPNPAGGAYDAPHIGTPSPGDTPTHSLLLQRLELGTPRLSGPRHKFLATPVHVL